MKTKSVIKNQKGFTLIEIIAVLVILGILAAIAIPRYLDMRVESIRNAAQGAVSELNARERLALAKSKLVPETANTFYVVDSYDLGTDWKSADLSEALPAQRTANNPHTVVIPDFKGKKVTLIKTPPLQLDDGKGGKIDNINEPAQWSLPKEGGVL